MSVVINPHKEKCTYKIKVQHYENLNKIRADFLWDLTNIEKYTIRFVFKELKEGIKLELEDVCGILARFNFL